jgi:anion-transporting  ArsA/GET3 family ATPase
MMCLKCACWILFRMVQEIHFVTGKGGVGKSIVALALAYKKASQGQRTLLVELGDESFYKDLLDLNSVGFKPTNLRPFLDLVCGNTPAICLR